MGGSLWLKHIRTGRKDPKTCDTDEHVGSDEVKEEYWSYSYSGFHWLKGQVLRGGIAYLEHLQTSAKEKEGAPEGAKQFFLERGIKGVVGAEDDEAAVKGAALVIGAALQVLNGWKREVRSTDPFMRLTAFGGGLPDLHGASIEDILDAPYRVSKIVTLLECPIELERAGMRGMYFIMRLPDNDAVIYSEGAQMISSVVERVKEQGKAVIEDEEQSECFEEMTTEFIQLLKDCKEGMYIQG